MINRILLKHDKVKNFEKSSWWVENKYKNILLIKENDNTQI